MAQSFENVRVFRIAETSVNADVVTEWLKDLGADEFANDWTGMAFDEITDPAMLVALAAKQCYMAFQPSLNPNLTKVRKDMVEYLDNVLKQKHGSVLEHAVFTYAINGCSRVFTGEMNRHRAGVGISERSMRYVRYDKINYWMPECFRDDSSLDAEERSKRDQSRRVMQNQFDGQEYAMARFTEIWADELADSSFHTKKVLTSAFRRIIGMGIATGGVWTLNARALRHVIALRTDPSAEEEIIHICKKIGRDMIMCEPQLFGDFNEENGALVPAYWKV